MFVWLIKKVKKFEYNCAFLKQDRTRAYPYSVLVTANDIVAPTANFMNPSNAKTKANFIPPTIITKINKRKRLIRLDRLGNNTSHSENIKEPESMLYEALYVIVGLFFNIYTSKKLKDRINKIKLKRIKVAENC